MGALAVLGPGGVGGFVAAALARARSDVLVVAHEPTAALINRQGLALRSVTLGHFEAFPRAVAQLEEPVDVLFVATKATGLEEALERIHATPRLIVPLLNGLEHVDLLRRRFGTERVAAGVIRIDSDRPRPGEIVHTSPSVRVDLAADSGAVAARLPAVVQALEAAGVPARIGESERHVLWSKLVRLCALASTTAASGRPIGFIRTDPDWRPLLIGCVEEAAATAAADGAQIEAKDTLAELDGAHEALGSSMQRDLAAGRVPELDAIQGAVLRAGARHGIPCPTIAALSVQIAQHAGIPAKA